MSPAPSNSSVDRAGAYLRSWWTDPGQLLLGPEADFATERLYRFRSTFAGPLKKVTVGVRQFVDRESKIMELEVNTGRHVVPVGQRLKRAPQIVNKLARFPHMRLSQMDDVGGCRAILGDRAEIDRVVRRMRKNRWDIRRIDDYISAPKHTGYRAVHVIVSRDGRLVEIQLRTRGQHDWAEAVDRTALRVDAPLGIGPHGLKDGHGPPDLLLYFEQAAFGIALEESGEAVDEAFEQRFVELREQVRPYFERKE